MLTFDNSLTFARGVEPAATLRNFDNPEDGFVWSLGKWCEITFPFETSLKPTGTGAELILEIDAFKVSEGLVAQNFLIYLNGLRIGSLLCSRRMTFMIPFQAGRLQRTDNVITVDTPDAALPRDYGVDDSRTLGMQLFSLQIRRTSAG
jgi:hypothetical protein